MAEAPKIDASLGKKEAQEAGTAEHNALIKTWDTYGKTAVRIVTGAMVFLLLVLSLSFGIPTLSGGRAGVSDYVLWVLVIVALAFATVALKRPMNLIAGFAIIALTAMFFSPFINRAVESADRKINHGDVTDPASVTRTIKNGTVTIKREGFDRFQLIGTVKIRNAYDEQCMQPRPSTPHTYRDLGNKYLVTENDGTPIYTMTWTADGRTYLIEMAPGRTEIITVTTVPVGEVGCRYVSS